MNFPQTPGQCKYMLALRSPKPIVIGTGPAGSGKTMLACQIALEHIGKYQRPRIVLTRPIVAWTKPMYDIFEKYLSHNQMERFISIEPLGYMRGRTFDNTLIIADEMQNATPNQMKMLLTRVGQGTKLIVTGDLAQSDLGPENGLEDLIYKMQCQDLEYIEHVEMEDEDIVRHPAVKEVLSILRK